MQGIIRKPRRPLGWIAPGPAPRGPGDDPTLQPRAGEDLCYLSGDWRIFQRIDGHRWSLDDLIVAWVARGTSESAPTDIADLGCGVGAVLMMMAWSFPSARVVGVEAQPISVDLACRSLRWNGAHDRCEVCLGDLRDPALIAAGRQFELITATPPYFPRGSAVESERVQWGPCHFEHRGGVEAYCAAAARLLAPAGHFVICAAARDRQRVAAGAHDVGLQIRSRLDVTPREGKLPLLSVYVMQAAADGASGITETALVVRDSSGRRTPSYLQVRHDMGMPP